MKSVNAQSLHNLYKTAHTALTSIDTLTKSSIDPSLKELLSKQYEGYEAVAAKLTKEMQDRNIQKKEPNIFKRAAMFTSIKFNTIKDDSKSHIAQMMVQGTTMGLTEVMSLLSSNGEIIDKSIKDIAVEFKDLMESYIQELKNYL